MTITIESMEAEFQEKFKLLDKKLRLLLAGEAHRIECQKHKK